MSRARLARPSGDRARCLLRLSDVRARTRRRLRRDPLRRSQRLSMTPCLIPLLHSPWRSAQLPEWDPTRPTSLLAAPKLARCAHLLFGPVILFSTAHCCVDVLQIMCLFLHRGIKYWCICACALRPDDECMFICLRANHYGYAGARVCTHIQSHAPSLVIPVSRYGIPCV